MNPETESKVETVTPAPESQPTVGESERLQAAFELIRRRCVDADIPVEDVTWPDGRKVLMLRLPNGRETKPIPVLTTRDAERILEIPFERFVILGDYQAICSYQDGMIEASLRTLRPLAGPSDQISRRLFGIDPYTGRTSASDIKAIQLLGGDAFPGLSIVIGPTSRELQALGDRHLPRLGVPSLRISGLHISQHDTAVEILEKVAHTLFFEIDLKLNLPLSLAKDRFRAFRGRRPADEHVDRELQFPNCEYPPQPMSLYWYARSALGMPLLQYLAYYQCIEFFFPVYSQTEAQKKVRNILKDPGFSAHRDTDVTRLLIAIRVGAGGGFGDERTQLKAALQECIDANELRIFLSEPPDRREFFSKNRQITDKRLSIANPTLDLRSEVAERVYDIRCRIVRTKAAAGETTSEQLLPFSKEADALDRDIELLQFLARRVLIAGSTALRI